MRTSFIGGFAGAAVIVALVLLHDKVEREVKRLQGFHRTLQEIRSL